MKEKTKNIIDDLIQQYPNLLSIKQSILDATEVLIETYEQDRKLLVCGNGGSASDSLHIVGELMKSFNEKRKIDQETYNKLKVLYPNEADSFYSTIEGALEAHSLVSETALITAFSNDKSADYVFAQQVYGMGRSGDVLFAISTSGNSKNVLLACQMAKARDMRVVGLTGKTGGKMVDYCDVTIIVPETKVYKIQELHLPIYHALCSALEIEFFS